MKKAVVYGGAGFVAGHLTKALSNSYDVVPVDVVPKQGVSLGDITKVADCERFCSGADVVVHLAGELPHAGWKKELPKGTMWNIMVNGTRNVLDESLKAGVKKVVYYSSSAVYGNPPSHALNEDAPHAPLDEYGKAKSEAERICHEYMDKGLDITIIRPMTILGPHFVGILRSMMEFIYRGKRFPIIGRGDNKIQLIHIDDIVDATVLSIEKPEAKNQTFNITSDLDGMPTIRQELDELCKYAGTGASVWPVPSYLVRPVLKLTNIVGKATMGKEIAMLADKTFLADNSKAKMMLGWKPKHNNIEALKAGYDWFKSDHENAKPNLSLPLKIVISVL